MVLFRSISALLFFATSTLLGQTNLTASEVVTKAHRAALKEATSADKVKGLRMEIKLTDAEKKPLGSAILELIAPQSRRQINYTPDFYVENITASNGLEGWISRRELKPGGREENKIITFKEVARMKDMTAGDLSFYKEPTQNTGTVKLLNATEIDGKKVYSVEYSFKSGFAIVRHFDAQTFELVASDQTTPEGKVQRQIVKELCWVDGLSFTKREEIYMDGKKVADAVYENITINPNVSESSFAFPVR